MPFSLAKSIRKKGGESQRRAPLSRLARVAVSLDHGFVDTPDACQANQPGCEIRDFDISADV